ARAGSRPAGIDVRPPGGVADSASATGCAAPRCTPSFSSGSGSGGKRDHLGADRARSLAVGGSTTPAVGGSTTPFADRVGHVRPAAPERPRPAGGRVLCRLVLELRVQLAAEQNE